VSAWAWLALGWATFIAAFVPAWSALRAHEKAQEDR
jgi:hypothetical protein